MDNIPVDLIIESEVNEDVNLLVGDNGSGKSQLLNRLADHYQRSGMRVIVIANSIHDKFEINKRNIYALRDRVGRRKTKLSIRNAILNVTTEGINRLKNASLSLEYAKFDPVIGIKLVEFDPSNNKIDMLNDSFSITSRGKDDINSLILKITNQAYSDIFWLKVTDYNFNEINQSIYTRFIKHESNLRKYGIISRIDFFLSRNNRQIPLLHASSGELSVITTLIYISTIINENTVILIDEPENSLHPKWQKDYVKMLLDNFHRYEPKIIIATHSPLILNGAEVTSEHTKVYKAENFQFKLHDNHSKNIEAAFVDYFDVITPANNTLSQRIIELMNELIENKTNFNSFIHDINSFEHLAYDENQIQLFDDVKQLAEKIITRDDNRQ